MSQQFIRQQHINPCPRNFETARRLKMVKSGMNPLLNCSNNRRGLFDFPTVYRESGCDRVPWTICLRFTNQTIHRCSTWNTSRSLSALIIPYANNYANVPRGTLLCRSSTSRMAYEKPPMDERPLRGFEITTKANAAEPTHPFRRRRCSTWNTHSS
jgi:hypothetical protein